jgi:citrate lyase subunit beta/citryl-CoA lyase
VIVDLEDGVAPAAKEQARANLPELLGSRREKPMYVRVNAGSEADLEAVVELPIEGVILPKVELPMELPQGLAVYCVIESAAALEAAYEIARLPGVAGIALGEADYRSQTGTLEAGLDWARSRIVNAAVAAGLPRPPQSAYPHVRDPEGLARSCRRGRELGHLGRSAIHPDQLSIIEQAYLPTEEEVARARATIERLAVGMGTLAGGEFVDVAMLGAARQIVALAERYG